jgi:hypothetical protein
MSKFEQMSKGLVQLEWPARDRAALVTRRAFHYLSSSTCLLPTLSILVMSKTYLNHIPGPRIVGIVISLFHPVPSPDIAHKRTVCRRARPGRTD